MDIVYTILEMLKRCSHGTEEQMFFEPLENSDCSHPAIVEGEEGHFVFVRGIGKGVNNCESDEVVGHAMNMNKASFGFRVRAQQSFNFKSIFSHEANEFTLKSISVFNRDTPRYGVCPSR